jgi:phenylacetate-CoA ligase
MLKSAIQQSTFIPQALHNERLSPAQVRAFQNRKLRAMVQHAWANSPFYRAKFQAAGLTPHDIQCVEDLAKLPPTTKAEIQAAGVDQVLARGYSAANTIDEATSGSSGKVLHIHHTHEAFNRYFAFAFRHLWGIGYRPWQRVAYTSFDALLPLPWEKIGLGQRQQIDLTRKDPRAYVEDLLRIQPQLITAYPSILQLVMNAATPAELARIRPHVIHLHSELLTESLRNQIRKAFGCDCFDDYSTFEFHHVAYECRLHRYHLAADNVIVEFMRDGGVRPEDARPLGAAQPGEEGEILLTGLTNHAMPLFRYAIGDVGIPSDEICPCGRGFPTMKLIQGRVDDFVIMPSGRRFSPRMINPVYEHLPGVMEHVLVQEALDHIVVHLNLDAAHQATTPALVKEALGNLFGEPVHLEVKLTTEFERGRTGKLRNVVSKVKHSLQNYN